MENKTYQGTEHNEVIIFGFTNHFSFHFISNLFSYQYLNSMCFTYVDLYES